MVNQGGKVTSLRVGAHFGHLPLNGPQGPTETCGGKRPHLVKFVPKNRVLQLGYQPSTTFTLGTRAAIIAMRGSAEKGVPCFHGVW